MKKQYSTTLKEARDLINASLRHEQAQMKEAIKIRRADQLDGCTTNLREIGFAFSTEQVDAAIHREDTLAAASNVLKQDLMGRMN